MGITGNDRTGKRKPGKVTPILQMGGSISEVEEKAWRASFLMAEDLKWDK
jgi:hypothetical protein